MTKAKAKANASSAEDERKPLDAIRRDVLVTRAVCARIQRGADVNAKDADGLTSLMKASDEGHVDVVRLLIERGADVNAANEEGWTALMYASSRGHVDVVRLLIERGADVHVVDARGRTALDLAIRDGDDDVIELLRSVDGTKANETNAELHTLVSLLHEHGQSMPEDAYVKMNASIQRLWRLTQPTRD